MYQKYGLTHPQNCQQVILQTSWPAGVTCCRTSTRKERHQTHHKQSSPPTASS
ncbi:hypothetical protein SCLCIDRAFT_1217843 [Scleroderma citrinum Foug A]|uniref:Uncharacterized protein n=1 Tax=Scleroderma citrinum Foug A TaxID=1036808 RepID=A0A0C3DTK3_9AGAM|nr:hypothetical protein SCLCIDRAFT_1217843 [Scleroderma citrinum Foug A]